LLALRPFTQHTPGRKGGKVIACGHYFAAFATLSKDFLSVGSEASELAIQAKGVRAFALSALSLKTLAQNLAVEGSNVRKFEHLNI